LIQVLKVLRKRSDQSRTMKTMRRNGLKGQQALSPGHRPGYMGTGKLALKGQKPYLVVDAFALTGRCLRTASTQGAALGWKLNAPSGRICEA
jgi:hypothetical protein